MIVCATQSGRVLRSLRCSVTASESLLRPRRATATIVDNLWVILAGPADKSALLHNVRIGSLADIRERIRDVRFIPRSRHSPRRFPCPLCAITEQASAFTTWTRVSRPRLIQKELARGGLALKCNPSANHLPCSPGCGNSFLAAAWRLRHAGKVSRPRLVLPGGKPNNNPISDGPRPVRPSGLRHRT
jgi:hypothetical protein